MKIHPSTYKIAKKYSKQYEEGLDAAIDGKSIDSNPYPPHTQRWIAWRCGYLFVKDNLIWTINLHRVK